MSQDWMPNAVVPGPLPDVGPPGAQDGSKPGCTYTSGTWQIVNGALKLVPPFQSPGGFEVK